jgi:predicted nuclease of predicted toxin-antitoxin system
MIRFVADEDFNNDIVRALRRRLPSLDLVRAYDAGLAGTSDPEVLAWAAREARILLTHDVNTMTHHALARIDANQPMPGVLIVRQSLAIGDVLEDLVLVAECSSSEEWDGQVGYLPLRSVEP